MSSHFIHRISILSNNINWAFIISNGSSINYKMIFTQDRIPCLKKLIWSLQRSRTVFSFWSIWWIKKIINNKNVSSWGSNFTSWGKTFFGVSPCTIKPIEYSWRSTRGGGKEKNIKLARKGVFGNSDIAYSLIFIYLCGMYYINIYTYIKWFSHCFASSPNVNIFFPNFFSFQARISTYTLCMCSSLRCLYVLLLLL